MIRKELVERMVENYKRQVEIVERFGVKHKVTLREYLQEIEDNSDEMTQEEVEYGASLIAPEK